MLEHNRFDWSMDYSSERSYKDKIKIKEKTLKNKTRHKQF